MRKSLVVFAVTLALVLAFGGLAQAAEVTEDNLFALMPAGMNADGVLTRGDFAVLLNAAAELSAAPADTALPADIAPGSPAADAVKNLLAAGILRGYPGGGIGISQPVTRAQAAVFISRTLGLPTAVDPGTVAGLEGIKGHWAYRPYAWMVREGLMDIGAPDEQMTVADGVALLAKVFGPVEKARQINEQSRVAQKDVKTMRMQGQMAIEMNMRAIPDAGIPAGMPQDLRATADISLEMNLEQGMHEAITMEIPVPEEKQPLKVQVDYYYTSEGVYFNVTDPATGKSEWQKMPEGLMPDFTEMMKQSLAQTANPVPPEIEKMFYYRYLGEEQVNGRAVYKMSSYGQIRDFARFMDLFASQLGGQLNNQFNEMLKMTEALIEAMHISGVAYIDKETLVPLKMDMLLVMGFTPQFMGEPNPMESVAIDYDLTFSDFNGEINIVLPAEAKDAPVMEMPAAPGTATAPAQTPDA
ncbi:MAG: S-layer homology domain-containing protein [Thermoanaerobacterales bacterium]|nr:S-layer homology domain-containing protein [Thermoanaerobacterales bacterium]